MSREHWQTVAALVVGIIVVGGYVWATTRPDNRDEYTKFIDDHKNDKPNGQQIRFR